MHRGRGLIRMEGRYGIGKGGRKQPLGFGAVQPKRIEENL
jgi:hypothetical protein